MTPITDMDLPDDVVEAAYDARIRAQAQRGTSELSADEVLECEAAAIRAALQAMCDCGTASLSQQKIATKNTSENVYVDCLTIRLERSRHDGR